MFIGLGLGLWFGLGLGHLSVVNVILCGVRGYLDRVLLLQSIKNVDHTLANNRGLRASIMYWLIHARYSSHNQYKHQFL